ncbi:regulator of sigma E protease [Trypanosoma cruzi]|nr:regulator of sigma E protease [Trypanosoma cruzi]
MQFDSRREDAIRHSTVPLRGQSIIAKTHHIPAHNVWSLLPFGPAVLPLVLQLLNGDKDTDRLPHIVLMFSGDGLRLNSALSPARHLAYRRSWQRAAVFPQHLLEYAHGCRGSLQ